MKSAKQLGGMVVMVAAVVSLASLGATKLPSEEPLWPGGIKDQGIVHREAEKNTLMIGKTGKYGGGASFVSVPTLMVLPAPKEKASRACVVVYPGGGNRSIVLGKEGMEIARRLNDMGITSVVVKYRTIALADPNSRPTREDYRTQYPSIAADGKRAVQIVRSRAAELGVDPNKIGVMGFSAGGYLAASVMLDVDSVKVDMNDPVNKVSSRPDFTCIVYGGFSPEAFAKAKMPLGPCFIAIAANDDKVPASDAMASFEMLRKAKMPAELHVFQSGGHGFGIGRDNDTTNMWMEVFGVWLKQNGFHR